MSLPVIACRIGFNRCSPFCCCFVAFFGIVGSISWLDLCDGGWSYRLLEVDKFYGNASFVQNYLIIPIMFYQFWNTILCLILPDIRDPVMIVHHILTGLLAYCATYPFACYYALFFFGLSETTQLPLTIVDVLDHFPSIRNNHPFVDALSKNLFGAMFFLVRIVLWTKVSVEFWAGCLDLLHQPHVHDKLVVMFMLLSNVILTGMQYLWAIKIGKIAIFGGEIQEKKVE